MHGIGLAICLAYGSLQELYLGLAMVEGPHLAVSEPKL
jgi:hypothetical protein